MADQQSAASHTGTSEVADTKGKGKAAADAGPEVSMDEESSSEEEGAEETHAEDDEDEDNMEEITTDNIISGGRRTRGRNIDFQKAAQDAGDDLDEDEDDDDDFEGGEDEDDAMHD